MIYLLNHRVADILGFFSWHYFFFCHFYSPWNQSVVVILFLGSLCFLTLLFSLEVGWGQHFFFSITILVLTHLLSFEATQHVANIFDNTVSLHFSFGALCGRHYVTGHFSFLVFFIRRIGRCTVLNLEGLSV